VAFANGAGGKIVIGVEDKTLRVVGVDAASLPTICDSIANAISDLCTPRILPDIDPETLEGKNIIVVEIGPGQNRPYYIKSSGPKKGTFIRVGGTTRIADEAVLKDLQLQGINASFDEQVYVGAEYDETAAEKLCKAAEHYIFEAENVKKTIRSNQLERWGLLKRAGRKIAPTNAFMLMTENPFPFAKIQCALFKGTARAVFIDKREYDGPLYEQIEEAYNFVLRHINLGAEINGLIRSDVYELPPEGIREMIVNAVAHRNYSENSCVQVFVYDDRVEVTSPGMLSGGITLNMILSGASSVRNRAVTAMFAQMRIVENFGTGIQRIIEACREYGVADPEFVELGTAFRVNLYRRPQIKEKLPEQAKLLWAKTPNNRRFGGIARNLDEDAWLPLCAHMADSAEVAVKLWKTWIPNGVKQLIHENATFAYKLFRFLAAVHDIGKATPAFQQKSQCLADAAGLPMPRMSDPNKIPHGLAGHCILARRGFDDSLAVVVGGHHGAPPTTGALYVASAHKADMGLDMPEWVALQDALLRYACDLAGLTVKEAEQTVIAPHVQALLTGLVIMTDWIASDEKNFEYLSIPARLRLRPSFQRVADAWENLDLPPYWKAEESLRSAEELFCGRFGIKTPRPVQTEVVRVLSEAKNPGIVVIEAPMGEGKTEAALAAVEILAAKAGKGGVFVGLPTMATSDGMFGRVKEWVRALGDDAGERYSMFLAHGKANLNDEYNGLKIDPNVGDGGAESVVANEWFQGRKKGILADFAVGTVDQLLFAALKTRHVALRHLAFAYKAVIIDECHAYDAYMNSYLQRALEWLGKYRTPVVILSATLPVATRRKLVKAYMGISHKPAHSAGPVWKQKANPDPVEAPQKPAWETCTDYPLITYSDGEDVKSAKAAPSGRSTSVAFEYLPDEDLPDKLFALLSDGGCAGVVCDTVDRAQNAMRILKTRFAETDADVELIHSRFLSVDRARKENALRKKLGPRSRTEDGSRPQRLIAVGTQVLEQSLDIDFDLLVSDIAPMDLLLQRVGRLHRHERTRPAKLREARCFVTGVADASEWVFAPSIEKIYDRYALLNTLLLLPTAEKRVVLPGDISPLVQTAYAEPDGDGATPAELLTGRAASAQTKREALKSAREAYEKKLCDKEKRADAFRLRAPAGGAENSLIDWLDVTKGDKNDQRAEASVRDTEESLEVTVVQKKSDGKLHLLPWIGDKERNVPRGAEISAECTPDGNAARVAATCTVSLPMLLCNPGTIDKVIDELEKKSIAFGLDGWQDSPWLKGVLPLILDENLRAEILDFVVDYDEATGLSAKRNEAKT
jgi:CRISPR-associated endonuclease/helicase Cas3